MLINGRRIRIFELTSGGTEHIQMQTKHNRYEWIPVEEMEILHQNLDGARLKEVIIWSSARPDESVQPAFVDLASLHL